MSLDKKIPTEDLFVINRSDNKRYPPGFEYSIDGVIYTVKKDVTKDAGSEMRQVVTSDNQVEIMSLNVIDRDLEDPNVVILNNGQSNEEENEEESDKEGKTKNDNEEESK